MEHICLDCDYHGKSGCWWKLEASDGACNRFRPLPRPLYEELDLFGADEDYGPGGSRCADETEIVVGVA
jgi:hypothetical protein